MAAPVIQSFEFALAGGLTATSVTVNKPAGVTAGDLLVLLVGNEDNTATVSFAAKTGWTKEYEFGNATPDTKIGMYWRIADGTEPASENISWSSTGSDSGGAWYLRITGADPTSTIEQVGPSSQTAGATSQAAASITPAVNECLVIAHHSFDGGDGTRSVSGTNWPSSFPANQVLHDTTGTTAWSGGWVHQTQSTAAASNACTFASTVSDGMVQVQFAIAPIQEGIATVSPTEFDYDEPSIDVAGLNFLATQTTATVYISDAATLAGSVNEVDITSAVNTWSDSNINLDLTLLSAGELASLQTLGPGARFIIVLTSTPDEYSKAVTTHRPQAFEMALGAATPGTTTARLTGLTGTFGGGRIEETAAQNPSTTTTDVAANGNREDVWSIQGKTLSREVQYDFRVLYGGIEATSYTVTPKVTIGAATGTTALTTVNSTGSVGTLDKTSDIDITTVVGTSNVGTVGISADLTTALATSAAGTLDKTLDIDITGVFGTSAVEDLDKTNTVDLSNVLATSVVDTVTESISITRLLSNVLTTSNVGSVGFTKSGSTSLSSVLATSSIDTVDKTNTVDLSNVLATSVVDTVTESISITRLLSDIEITSNVGNLGFTKSATVAISGVNSTSNIGGLGFTESGNVGLTNVLVTTQVGNLGFTKSATLELSSIEITSALGTVGASSSGIATLSGVNSASQVGNLGFNKSASLPISGIEIASNIGLFGISIGASREAPSISITTAVGSVSFIKSGTVILAGNTSLTELGNLGLSIDGSLAITGILASSILESVGITKSGSSSLTGVWTTSGLGTVDFTESGTVILTGTSITASTGSISVVPIFIPSDIVYYKIYYENRTYTIVDEDRVLIVRGKTGSKSPATIPPAPLPVITIVGVQATSTVGNILIRGFDDGFDEGFK